MSDDDDDDDDDDKDDDKDDDDDNPPTLVILAHGFAFIAACSLSFYRRRENTWPKCNDEKKRKPKGKRKWERPGRHGFPRCMDGDILCVYQSY